MSRKLPPDVRERHRKAAQRKYESTPEAQALARERRRRYESTAEARAQRAERKRRCRAALRALEDVDDEAAPTV